MTHLRPWLPAIGLAALAACTAAPGIRPTAAAPPAAADPRWEAVLASAAAQVRRCYRGPRVGYSGRQIVTRVRVSVTADGAVAGRPAIIGQEGLTATNRIYAERMAAAAIESVLRCAPLRLPEGFAAGNGVEFDLTFSPLSSA